MRTRLFLVGTLVSVFAGSVSAQMSVSITSTAHQVALGTAVGFAAQVDGADPVGSAPPPLWYRYRVRLVGQDYQMVRDFGPREDLLWAPSAREGAYEVEVTAMNLATGETVAQTSVVQVSPLAYAAPVITPTSHP